MYEVCRFTNTTLYKTGSKLQEMNGIGYNEEAEILVIFIFFHMF